VGGAIVYANRLKHELLGVADDLLLAHGAVSEPVARAMAEGARRRFDAAWALAITGVAGPGGGTPDKPVGTVHLALAGVESTDHLRVRLPGDRERVRWQASQLALDLLRRRLLGLPLEAYWIVSDSAGDSGGSGESDRSDRSVSSDETDETDESDGSHGSHGSDRAAEAAAVSSGAAATGERRA
jgi:PncC family amidohydrolase